MLSMAAFEQGRHAQAFPSFGSERTGAPVVAFCRIDDREIRLREPVLAPDVLIVQDPTLLHQVDVFQGLKPDGYVLINSRRSFDELGAGGGRPRFRHERLTTVPASEIALKHLGRPLPNAACWAASQRCPGWSRWRRWCTPSATSSAAHWPRATWPPPPRPSRTCGKEIEELAHAQAD
jgi:2-oxoacid:acceptor oxidoreductase gamma subunit (pyruvate/2-ketoisovalerate family)